MLQENDLANMYSISFLVGTEMRSMLIYLEMCIVVLQ
jgi:hypothetical protein